MKKSPEKILIYDDFAAPDRTEEHQTESQKESFEERDAIYKKLLSDLQQADVSFQKFIGLNPLKTFSRNFDNFNYGRGFHYFFDLRTFTRVQNSPSYVVDLENRFNSTYSYDEQILNGIKLKNLFNRKYVSIPSVSTTFDDKESKDKNVCHYHLFNIEDKKYHNNRLIYKYKYVLKNLQKLHQNDQLKQYTELKKDVVTFQVSEKNVPIKKKKEILKNRIAVLEQREKNMTSYWDWEDDRYYYFSLDQLFHNQAMSKGKKLSEKFLQHTILKRIAYRKQYIQNIQFGGLGKSSEKLRHAIQTWMIFQEQQNNALSILMQNKLKALPKIVQMFRRNEELVIFPLFTFNFGSKDIERFIDPLIKAKLENHHRKCFYVYKAFVNRLLKRQLACQEEEVVEPMNYEQYIKQMRQKLKRIQNFYKKEIVARKKVLFVDDIIQFQKLENSQITQKVHLLEPGHKIQISLKELMLLFYYRNISIALEQFIEYLNKDPEILKFMADQNYHNFHYSTAKVLHEPEFCILINDLNRFDEILSSQNTCPDLDKKLCFSFNQKLRIAYAWHEPYSQEWETMNKKETIEDPKPTKKTKID